MRVDINNRRYSTALIFANKNKQIKSWHCRAKPGLSLPLSVSGTPAAREACISSGCLPQCQRCQSSTKRGQIQDEHGRELVVCAVTIRHSIRSDTRRNVPVTGDTPCSQQSQLSWSVRHVNFCCCAL